jgi:hypothetical protein
VEYSVFNVLAGFSVWRRMSEPLEYHNAKPPCNQKNQHKYFSRYHIVIQIVSRTVKNYLIKTLKKIFLFQKSSLLLGNKNKHIITDSKSTVYYEFTEKNNVGGVDVFDVNHHFCADGWRQSRRCRG